MTVTACTLDTYCESTGWHPDVMKVDVEEHEVPVLEGAQQVLREHRPAIVCEVLPSAPRKDDLRSLLRAHGYTPFALLQEGMFHDEEFAADRTFHDYVFLPGTAYPTSIQYSALHEVRGT